MEFKFRTDEDKDACIKLAESNKQSLEEWVKHRYKILTQLDNFMPNFRQSQDMKRNWKLDRKRYVSAIDKWHNSVAGKRFHRQLGRYLALRAPLYQESLVADSLDKSSEEYYSTMAKIAINSMMTHLLIESLYIEPDLDEHMQMREFLKMTEAYLSDIFSKLTNNENLTQDDLTFLEEINNV